MVNGFVDLGRTAFMTSGSQDHITTFLARVSRLLHDLPAERFEHERRVLRTEAQTRSPGLIDDLLTWRFGARTYGLNGYREWGLESLQLEELHRWTAERFVAQNAVLWLSFEPPDGLELALPSGRRHGLPCGDERSGLFPGAMRWGVLAGLSWPSRRTPEAAMAEFALARCLERQLRHTDGVAYSVAQDLIDIGPDRTLATLVVDAAYGHHQSVTDTIQRVAREFAERGHTAEDADAWRHGWRESQEHPDSALGILDAMARRRLFGQPVLRSEEWMEAAVSANAEAVAEVVRRGLDETTHVIPHGATPGAGIALLKATGKGSLAGRRWSRAQHAQPLGTPPLGLVIGDDGIQQTGEAGDPAVRWADAVGVLQWDDGSRIVVGADGTEVAVVPHRWVDGDSATAEIDRRSNAPAVRAGRRLRAPDRRARDRHRLIDPWLLLPALLGTFWLLNGVAQLLGSVEPVDDTPPLAFVVLGVAALAFIAHRVRKNHADRAGLRTWDNAADRWGDGYPSDAPSTGAYTVGALCLAWLATENLLRQGFAADTGPVFEEFQARTATPVKLYVEWDGILTTDMVSDRGNAFLHWYFRETRNGTCRFDDDLHAVVRAQDVPTFHHLPDDWTVFDHFSQLASDRYRRWSSEWGRLAPS